MNYFLGDKIVLTKAFGKLTEIGKVFEVGNINDTHVVIRDEASKLAIAAIELNLMDVHFTKYESRNTAKWSQWQGIVNSEGDVYLYFRTNLKKVQVRTPDGKYRGEATCNKNDLFDMGVGLKLASMRCAVKLYDGMIANYNDACKNIEIELANTKQEMKKLINKLDK